MKKLVVLITGIILLTSCTTFKFVSPSIGTWKSDDPIITINVTSEGWSHYGTFVKDDEEVEVEFVFGHVSNVLFIYDLVLKDENRKRIEGGKIAMSGREYTHFTGRYKIENDTIYYDLGVNGQHGVEKIIFRKITDD